MLADSVVIQACQTAATLLDPFAATEQGVLDLAGVANQLGPVLDQTDLWQNKGLVPLWHWVLDHLEVQVALGDQVALLRRPSC